jgi:hypothetical protein
MTYECRDFVSQTAPFGGAQIRKFTEAQAVVAAAILGAMLLVFY